MRSPEASEKVHPGAQTRNVISSMARSFPFPPGAFEIINKATEVLGATNELPYFVQVICGVGGIFPEDI